jgi:flagellar biosynthesis/type III secretory pathway protein FliH
MQALPWALDELELPDIFPLPADVPSPAVQAAAEADLMRAQFAAERTRAEQDAYARGRADAERAVRAQLESEVAAAAAALREAVAAVQLHEARWVANAEENVAALAVAVARHIVQHEVTADPAAVRALVMRALVQLPVDGAITVRLHPADLEACSTLIQPDASGRTPDVRFTADPHIVRGGCLVEGRERIIDGRIDTALERAYRRIGNVQA